MIKQKFGQKDCPISYGRTGISGWTGKNDREVVTIHRRIAVFSDWDVLIKMNASFFFLFQAITEGNNVTHRYFFFGAFIHIFLIGYGQ